MWAFLLALFKHTINDTIASNNITIRHPVVHITVISNTGVVLAVIVDRSPLLETSGTLVVVNYNDDIDVMMTAAAIKWNNLINCQEFVK